MRMYRALFLLYAISTTLIPLYAKTVPGDTGPDRTAEEIAKHQANLQRSGNASTSLRTRAIKDQGNVSVLQDDGTLIIPQNKFDLAGRSLTFTPQGTQYLLQAGGSAFDPGQGGRIVLPLGDDDSAPVDLPFTFKFFGTNYTTAYINTDGNLTFGASDIDSGARNLRRVLGGPPRIAPAFDDFLPSGTGIVTVEKFADRMIVSWVAINEFGFRSTSTFQVILRSSGVIQFNYQTMNITAAVVGISPGRGSSPHLVDLSLQTGAVISGTTAEVFSNTDELDLPAISAAFYEAHQDAYDALIVFSDFDISLEDAFAYEVPVRNDVQGIMPVYGTFDFGADFSSSQRLSSIVNAGALAQYPDDPSQIFLGSNNTLEVLGQEFGHRWLAFVDTSPPSMLGRDQAHWSFFMNTDGSVMEGNQIEDLGNGRFRTVAATYRYSALDQYIMGLRAASEVPPWFVVTTPRLISAPSNFQCTRLIASCSPTVGVEFSGVRRDIAVTDIIATAGARVPSVDSAQKNFSVAFVLLIRSGQDPNPKSLAHVDAVRAQWEGFFTNAVEGRGTMATNLLYNTVTEVNVGVAAGGSAVVETLSTPALQTGYGSLESAFGVAVIRSSNGSDLVSEAAVAAAPTSNHWVMYAERSGAVATGIAIANPTSSPANLILRLSTGAQTTLQIPPNGQRAAFVHELFASAQGFLGTLTIDSDASVAVIALRGSPNRNGGYIITTMPATAGVESSSSANAFPIVADGGGYNTEFLLVNAGTAASVGRIQLSFGSPIPFSVAPGSAAKFQTAGLAASVTSGSATVVVDSGPSPTADAVVRFSTSAGLVSEMGLPAQRAVANGITFVSANENLRTGFALFNPSFGSVQVRLTVRDSSGAIIASSSPISLAAGARVSSFLDELIAGLPLTLDGTVTVDASSPIDAVAVRGTTTRDGGFVMSAIPVFDRTQAPPAISYFPQIASGSLYTTEFLIGNALTGAVHLTFRDPSGNPLGLVVE